MKDGAHLSLKAYCLAIASRLGVDVDDTVFAGPFSIVKISESA